jgi:hypothetical protein
MAQTQSDPSQKSSTIAPSSSAGAGAPVDDDPLSHLHRMSTTAGLGSGEYVAVNAFAVFALILGLASLLTLIEELLLVIPVACVVISIVAWRQINQSNGTQTGRGLIAIALLCAIGIGGFVVARKATEGVRTRNDRVAIDKTLVEWGGKIKSGDLEGAYKMLSDHFQEAVPFDMFKVRMEFFRKSDLYGSLQNTTTNGLVGFQNDPATNQQFATTKMTMQLDRTQVVEQVSLRKSGDQWIIENLPTLLPPPPDPNQRR